MMSKTLLSAFVLTTMVSLTAGAQTVKATITFPDLLAGIAADSFNHRVYLVEPSFSGTTDKLIVINGKTNQAIKTIRVPAGAYLPAVNLLTHIVYIASCNYSETPSPCFVTVVDSIAGKVIANVPVTTTAGDGIQGIAINLITSDVYIANASDNEIDVIGSTNKVTKKISLAGQTPLGLAMNPFNQSLYAVTGSNNLLVINPSTGHIRATTPYGSSLAFDAVNWFSGDVFVTDSVPGPATVGVFDESATPLAAVALPSGDQPYGIDVDQLRNKVFVASLALNTVTEIDGSTNTVVGTASNVPAAFVSVDFVDDCVYVSGGNTVTVLSE